MFTGQRFVADAAAGDVNALILGQEELRQCFSSAEKSHTTQPLLRKPVRGLQQGSVCDGREAILLARTHVKSTCLGQHNRASMTSTPIGRNHGEDVDLTRRQKMVNVLRGQQSVLYISGCAWSCRVLYSQPELNEGVATCSLTHKETTAWRRGEL